MARPNLRRQDANTRFVHIGRHLDGEERTDGKRWNHVITARFPEQLMPADFGLRHCERAKAKKS
jgi:hypothetical protein